MVGVCPCRTSRSVVIEGEPRWRAGAATVVAVTIPMRPPTDGPGASGLGVRRAAPRPTRPAGPDPLAPLLEPAMARSLPSRVSRLGRPSVAVFFAGITDPA